MFKPFIAIASFVVVMALMGFYIIGILNSENALRQSLKAHQSNLEVTYDNTWKIIKEQAAVSDSYKEAFKQIYPEIIKGRYQDSQNLLVKFVTEANPQFDISLRRKRAPDGAADDPRPRMAQVTSG